MYCIVLYRNVLHYNTLQYMVTCSNCTVMYSNVQGEGEGLGRSRKVWLSNGFLSKQWGALSRGRLTANS